MTKRLHPDHAAEIQAAVQNLNQTLERMIAEYGDAVEFRTNSGFSCTDGDRHARVWVDVVEGRYVIL